MVPKCWDPSAVDAFGQQSLVAPDFLHDEFDVSKVMGKKTCKNPKLDEVGHEKTYDNGKSVVDNERKESDADDCFSKEIRKLKEKYEQELKDTRARELIHAKKAALLAKQLKDQQIKYDSLIIKEIQSHSEQKPQEELQKKDNEIHEQIQKRQIAEANLKNADLSLLVNVEKEIDKQLKLSQVSSSDSAAIQSVELSVLLDRDKEIDNIKKYICQLEAEETKLRLNLEAAKMGCQLEESMLLYHLEEARHRLKKTECSSETLEFDVMAALTQLHDIFLCPCEIGYMSLRKLLDAPDSKIFRIRVVPGKKKDQLPEPQDAAQGIRNPRYVVPPRRTPQIKLPDLKKMSPFGKFVMSDLIDDVFRLHRAGLCLNGKFGLNHFFYVPASKRIKLDPQLKSRASKRTLDGMNLDYFALHGTIVLILSLYEDSIPVPFDLKYLLGLMSCEDPVSKEVLIRYNASLMTELQKRDHFITLYDRMEQLDREDEAEHVAKKNFRSEKVLKFISAAYTDEWASLLYDNDFIEMVCTKYKNDTQKVLSGPRDLLMTWRHNFTHLHEKSTAFEDKDEMDMLDYVASGVLNQFQEGMHSIGQLEIPHLAHTMK